MGGGDSHAVPDGTDVVKFVRSQVRQGRQAELAGQKAGQLKRLDELCFVEPQGGRR